ncbi:hypothetical protein MAP00_005497 [Monascus purpureus]|nr:hypothetical protein MAP00_005497 [Monascus purpureus]
MAGLLRLPAEGVTLEYLAAPLHKVLLQPVITGAVLASVLKSPETVQRLIASVTKKTIDLARLTKTLKILVGLGIVYRLNRLLNRAVLNNFTRDKWDWSKEIIVITGGSGGFGELMVRKFSQRNIKIVVLDLKPPANPFPPNVHFYAVNVTDADAVQQVAKQIKQEVGDPTVLINNAGIITGQTILGGSMEGIRRTFEVNIIAFFPLVKAFLPSMIAKNHGHIVTLASMASFATVASNVDYSCTKAAALSFHEGLAQEITWRYKARKIRTTVVQPFWARTPLLDSLPKKPFQPLLEPETVANAVVKQVLKGESGQIILPERYWIAGSFLRGFPNWIQEISRALHMLPPEAKH